MNVGNCRLAEDVEWAYHTQMDDMSAVSCESLAMSVISNGIMAIELDKSVLIPYTINSGASCLDSKLDDTCTELELIIDELS